jgi:tryptophan synthase beta chain
MEAVAVPQPDTFEAGVLFTQTEGIIPAPESSHAIRVVLNEAMDVKEKGEEEVILFNHSGHGLLYLSAYDAYHLGYLIDETLEDSPEVIQRRLPIVNF